MEAIYVVLYLGIVLALSIGYSDYFTEDFTYTGFDTLETPAATPKVRAAGSGQ